MSRDATLSVIGLSEECLDLLESGGIRTFVDLIETTIPQIADLPGCTMRHLAEITQALESIDVTLPGRLNGKELPLDVEPEFACIVDFAKPRGRPKGAKDKNPGSEARRRANRANSFRNGNGSRRTDLDRFKFDGAKTLSPEQVERYGSMYSDALSGQSEVLEDSMAQTLGHMRALFDQLLRGFLERGTVDIPIPVVGPSGEVLQDSNGNDVVRAVKTPRGNVDMFNFLGKALGIDVKAMVLSAESQGRHRAVSDEGTLDEVEKSMSELTEARVKFGNLG